MENPIEIDDLGYHYFWKHPNIAGSAGSKFRIRTEVFIFGIAMRRTRALAGSSKNYTL